MNNVDLDTCPGCAARIPPSRPRFCEYCGATLPTPLVAAADHAASPGSGMSPEPMAAPRARSSFAVLLVTLFVVGAVLFLGCCAVFGVRVAPP